MPTDLFADDNLGIDPSKDYFADLVGEDKRFKTPQDLARAKAESDAFIEQLKGEQARLRADLATRLKYEDFIDKLNSQPKPSNQGLQNQEEPQKDKSAMTPEELEHFLEQKLNQHDNQKSALQNLAVVKAKLQEAFGPNYAQRLKQEASQLDLTEAEVESLAASKPKTLFRLLGLDGEIKKSQDLFASPPRTQFTTTSTNLGVKGDSYFEEIRKKEPTRYWSAKVQNELHDRLREMGEEQFYKS